MRILAPVSGKFDEGLPGRHLERTSVREGELERLRHLALAPGAGHVAAAVEVVELAVGIDDVVQRLVMAAARGRSCRSAASP